MNVWHIGLSSNKSYNKYCTIPYFIKLISDRANFAVSGPTSLQKNRVFCICLVMNFLNEIQSSPCKENSKSFGGIFSTPLIKCLGKSIVSTMKYA